MELLFRSRRPQEVTERADEFDECGLRNEVSWSELHVENVSHLEFLLWIKELMVTQQSAKFLLKQAYVRS